MWVDGGIAGEIMLERKVLAKWFDIRKGKACKSNVRIGKTKIVQRNNGIRADNPYNVKISEGQGERTWVN